MNLLAVNGSPRGKHGNTEQLTAIIPEGSTERRSRRGSGLLLQPRYDGLNGFSGFVVYAINC